MRFSETKLVEFGRFLHPPFTLHLVDRQNHRLPGAAHQLGDFEVQVCQACGTVNEEDDGISLIDSKIRLLSDFCHEFYLVKLYPAGVDKNKWMAIPFAICI